MLDEGQYIQTKFKKYHAESVFRPHSYSTLPMSTVNPIDFRCEIRAAWRRIWTAQTLLFVVTFDTSHLAI